MFKQIKPGILFLVLGIILASILFLGTQPLGASGQVDEEAKDGAQSRCRIFVQGSHAYVLRHVTIPASMDYDGYLRIFDLSESIDAPCGSLFIHHAEEVFVYGGYLYTAGQYYSWGFRVVLKKFDISDPCEPDLVDSVDTTCCSSSLYCITDMYITGDSAYITTDMLGIDIFEVSSTAFRYSRSICVGGGVSRQGVHVRGGYMYLANEGWISVYDFSENTEHFPEYFTGAARDVYNVVCAFETVDAKHSPVTIAKSITYEAANDSMSGYTNRLNVWDTDEITDMDTLGSCSYDQTSNGVGVVRVNGDWVYWLPATGGPVVVCAGCVSVPETVATYGESAHDFHVVHDGTGQAHIYGARPAGTDSGVVFWYAEGNNHTIEPYLYGDVNGDTQISTADLTALSNYLLGYNTIVRLDGCDVNCDGEVNTDDYDYLLSFLAYSEPVPGADCQFYHYVFGDANGDGELNSADFVYLINYLYLQKSPPDPMAAGDPNCDCEVDIGDVTYLSNYLFLGGSPPRQGCAE